MDDKRVIFLHDFLDFLFSIIRLLIKTKFKETRKISHKKRNCILMGNGPSLKELLSENQQMIADYDLIAVNFMGINPEFSIYKPNIYVLCDPAFWFSKEVSEDTQKKAHDLYCHLKEKTDWDLQLYLPYEAGKVKLINEILSKNKHIQIHYFNKTKFEGCSAISHLVYNRQWGMPRTENVLIAALMLAIYSQYKRIYLAGVENDWMKNLAVDENNRLYIKQTHFYSEEQEKNKQILLNYKMYEICQSLSFAFKGYVDIDRYAKKCGIIIYNLNKDSYIDAFTKTELTKTDNHDA